MPRIFDHEALDRFKKVDAAHARAKEREEAARAAFIERRSDQTKEAWADALKEVLRIEEERWALHKEYFFDLTDLESQPLHAQDLEELRIAREEWNHLQKEVNEAINIGAPREILNAAFLRLHTAGERLRALRAKSKGKRLT